MKRKLLLILIAITTLIIFHGNAYAISNDVNVTQIKRAEETGYKYTYIGGILHKRLWSYTRSVWIDPYWIPVN